MLGSGRSPTRNDIVAERGGEPQLILHILPLHLFYMMYALGVICSISVFIKTRLAHGLIAAGPESFSSCGSPSTLGWLRRPRAQAANPWSEASCSNPTGRPYCTAGEQEQGVRARGGWSPMPCPHQGRNPARINSVAPGKASSRLPQHCGHQRSVFSEMWILKMTS